jgi:hypothetical protein
MRPSSLLLGLASTALLASAAAGCSFVVDFDRSRVGATDAGRDGGPGMDVGPADAGPEMDDAGSDAGPMPMDDAGSDAGPMPMDDAGSDAGPMMDDAGSDAGPAPADAGSDAPMESDAGPCGGDPRIGMACDPTNACETGVFACVSGMVECMGTGTARPSTHVCRAAVAGGCDVAETCNGTALTCPADVVAAAATSCRASAGDCDVAETCDGTSPACPADAFAAATVECRAAMGECDVAETCSGTGAACPADAFAAMGTACTTPAMGQCSGTSGACGCAAGRTACAGTCTDTATDPNNCGMCGMACSTPTPNCVASACAM